MLTDQQWRERISQITDRLWVGEVAVRSRCDLLKDVGVHSVVSILTRDQAEKYDRDDEHPVSHYFNHSTFHYNDHADIPPQEMEKILASFGDRTLVHCVSGANRSTAVALCWLIVREGFSPTTAANRYWTARGRSTSHVYNTVPTMTLQMERNVDNYLKWYKQL